MHKVRDTNLISLPLINQRAALKVGVAYCQQNRQTLITTRQYVSEKLKIASHARYGNYHGCLLSDAR